MHTVPTRAAALVEHVAADPADVVGHLLVADVRRPRRGRLEIVAGPPAVAAQDRRTGPCRPPCRGRSRHGSARGPPGASEGLPIFRRARGGPPPRRPGRGSDVELAQDRRDVMGDRLLREEQPRGDLRVAQALGDEREDLEPPARSCPAGFARVVARGPRAPRAAPRSRSVRATRAAARAGAEALQLLEGAAQRRPRAACGEGERRLVRAADRRHARRGLGGARELELERLGVAPGARSSSRSRPAGARAARRRAHASCSRRGRARPRSRRRSGRASPAEPARLGARGRDRREPLQLPGARASSSASSSGRHGSGRRGARACGRGRRAA